MAKKAAGAVEKIRTTTTTITTTEPATATSAGPAPDLSPPVKILKFLRDNGPSDLAAILAGTEIAAEEARLYLHALIPERVRFADALYSLAEETLPAMYEQDETAWLEAMAALARDGRVDDLDLVHLAEYLSDMARRDRREVESRLVVLLAHVLKWTFQPDRRSRSWRSTVIGQRQELNRAVGRGILRNHAEAVLAEVYAEAVELAAAETGLSPGLFPAECPYTVDGLLALELPEDA